MIVNTITEARAQLSQLVQRAANGEEIVISLEGKPTAVLVPYKQPADIRQPGSMAGKIVIKEDFDSLPDEISAGFGMTE